jgi:hypothetical protein
MHVDSFSDVALSQQGAPGLMPDFYVTKVDFEENGRSCKILFMRFVEGEQMTGWVSASCNYL